MYSIAEWASRTQAWLGMGGQGIGVQDRFNPGEVSISNDKKWQSVRV